VSLTRYPFSLAPGATLKLDSRGRYVRYMDGRAQGGTAAIRIKAGNGGGDVYLLPGENIRYPQASSTFIVSNPGSTSVDGSVVIGDAELSGEHTLRTGLELTDDGVAYMGHARAESGNGTPGAIQLWNPTGSSKKAIIERIVCTTEFQCFAVATWATVQLQNFDAFGQSKKAGAAASVMQMRSELPAVPYIASRIFGAVVQQQSGVVVLDKAGPPLILGPGQGLTICTYASDQQLGANFEWLEGPV
jgi:hypothetical protein